MLSVRCNLWRGNVIISALTLFTFSWFLTQITTFITHSLSWKDRIHQKFGKILFAFQLNSTYKDLWLQSDIKPLQSVRFSINIVPVTSLTITETIARFRTNHSSVGWLCSFSWLPVLSGRSHWSLMIILAFFMPCFYSHILWFAQKRVRTLFHF